MPATARFHPARGELIDVGGRRLRVVRAGPSTPQPLVLCESGAFGFAADWGVVQDRLAAAGFRSLAYDRAGMGYSDPGPAPRDGAAIVGDLEILLERAGEPGPYILVGHSMAGLFVRLFAARNPHKVAGVVLVDAVTPEASDIAAAERAIHAFGQATRFWSRSAELGLLRPLAPLFGDRIGLTGEAQKEKRRQFAAGEHNRVASNEVLAWPATAAQAQAAGRYDPSWPVAVITAGGERGRQGLKAIQTAPALASRHGHVEHVQGSNHANLLGKAFADPIVRGVRHVLQSGAAPASPARA